MEIANMRSHIKNAYDNSPSWVDRVDRMPDNQVTAIYYNLLSKGKLNPKPKKKKEEYRQLTLFDVEFGGLRMHE